MNPVPAPRMFRADNPGPFTLDGTRTYLVGRERVAVIDPGPPSESHVGALAEAVSGAASVVILVTHDHDDHAGAAPALSRELGAPVVGYGPGARVPTQGEEVETDHGALIPVETPGHARKHAAFHWPAGEAVFPGDLVLGHGDTTWIGAYPGCVADYLESLAILGKLAPQVLYPPHGPPIRDVPGALRRYEDHRRQRIRQVEEALARTPGRSADDLVQLIYGREVPSALLPAARKSVEAILDHLGRP